MRISYLELRNYRRFREMKLQFPDGIVGILGANGSGKSTLIEGVAWALFGNTEEVVRTSRESIRTVGASSSESTFAALEFELDGSEYRIEREMSGKSMTMKAKLASGDRVLAEGDRPVRTAVEKLIGMDHKSFFTSVFARQKELNALQNVAAGERKKAVLRMLRIDGIDDALKEIRADKRDVAERIKGAEKTLIDGHGRDREMMIAEALPGLEKDLQEAETLLKASEEAESRASREFSEAKRTRDELRKDYDAHTTASRDLSAKRSALGELRSRREKLSKRIGDARAKLSGLPELESAEKEWKTVSERLEKLDGERQKAQQAAHLSEEVKSEEKQSSQLRQELSEVRKTILSLPDLAKQKENLKLLKDEADEAKQEIVKKTSELQTKVSERTKAATKDRSKLEEIRRAGRDGVCPTCERTLEDAYELLMSKLAEDIEKAEQEVSSARSEMDRLGAELKALAKKDEAIKKKGDWLDNESDRKRTLEAKAEGITDRIHGLEARVEERRKELAAVGEIHFSAEDHNRIRKDRDRLRPLHDEYVRTKGFEEETKRNEAEFAEVEDTISKRSLEEEGLNDLVQKLEPKKSQYELAVKHVDEKMNTLTAAKDEARMRGNRKEAAAAELAGARKDIETIARVKKGIEDERRRTDQLALLEDVVVSFRDHLIGKIAPTLAELTSHVVEMMTDSKYSRVELDDAYEIQLDDQGVAYPLSRFSGGEADLANLALRLAISRVIAERTGAVPINFLILDEIFGSLDPARKRSVMTALSGLSTQFRQIFLITHIDDVKDLMGYVISVEEREDGTSGVQLVS